jgi:mannose-1-phosphate guanylyltransferase/mannose-6-phosphate isomerase
LIQQVILCGRSGQALVQPMVEPIIVCGESERASVMEQLLRAGAPSKGVLIEPRRRGTAAALTLAAVHAVTLDDPVLLVVPSGTAIDDLKTPIQRAALLAGRGALVALGVPAAAPITGRACMRARAEYIDAFVAQPDAATARAYFDSGQCLWSSGIFALRASVWIDVIASLRTDIFKACERAYRHGKREGTCFRVDAGAFAACPAQSVECAVMEKIAGELSVLETMVVRLDAGWSGTGHFAHAA